MKSQLNRGGAETRSIPFCPNSTQGAERQSLTRINNNSCEDKLKAPGFRLTIFFEPVCELVWTVLLALVNRPYRRKQLAAQHVFVEK